MRFHEPTPPTADERGDEVHPAWGAISAHRITSTPGAVLFDSEITHGAFVRVTIGRMTRHRDLKRDWLHEKGGWPLIQVDMSEAQWASFVSSMNTSGVPCTIRMTETDQDVPGLEFAPRLAISARETREAAQEAFARIKEASDRLAEIGPTGPVKERRAAMRDLQMAIDSAPANVEFASQSLTKHTEEVVTKARADIEAMVEAHAAQIGIDPAQVRFLALEAPEHEEDQA